MRWIVLGGLRAGGLGRESGKNGMNVSRRWMRGFSMVSFCVFVRHVLRWRLGVRIPHLHVVNL